MAWIRGQGTKDRGDGFLGGAALAAVSVRACRIVEAATMGQRKQRESATVDVYVNVMIASANEAAW